MIRTAVVYCLASLFTVSVYAQANKKTASDNSARDERVIRKAIDSYCEAFNRGDAKGVASHWGDKGQWISPSGDRFVGRHAIEKEMKAYFSSGKQPVIEVIHPQVRFLTDSVAVEEGTARVLRPGEAPSETKYIAIHVKSNNRWKIDTVRETLVPSPPSNFEKLKDLQWLVGNWIDADQGTIVETKCEWSKNKNFLTRSFSASFEGEVEMAGTQVVGWDSVNEQVRSWVFDSNGGFGEGTWRRDGKRWIIRTKHTLSDGKKASSINMIEQMDDNSFRWQSTGRELDGELLPNLGPIIIRRK